MLVMNFNFLHHKNLTSRLWTRMTNLRIFFFPHFSPDDTSSRDWKQTTKKERSSLFLNLMVEISTPKWLYSWPDHLMPLNFIEKWRQRGWYFSKTLLALKSHPWAYVLWPWKTCLYAHSPKEGGTGLALQSPGGVWLSKRHRPRVVG